MAFDYKKEYANYYNPPTMPSIITIPPMNFIAIRGAGNPNDINGDYKKAIELLYGVAYTIKMSKKGSHQIKGYFDFVVPPLESLWWQDGMKVIDYLNKDAFKWVALIRVPEFITGDEFDWAILEATNKKNKDFSKVEFLTYNEGLCIQCMHIGSYDNELSTIQLMNKFIEKEGYAIDISDSRIHHEIYLSDVRRVSTENLKTIIRQPIIKL